MSATLQAAALQFPITMDVVRNIATLKRLCDGIAPETLVVAPEGTLSGYLPVKDLPDQLDEAATQRAIAEIAAFAAERRLHIVAGACVCDGAIWRNRSFYFASAGETHHYDKINLAHSERGAFTPGDALPVFATRIAGAPLTLGIQMCREIRYPEQWRVLATRGAQVIAYVNNAIGSTSGCDVWRAHVISRAAELQRFVIGANNAALDQTCPTLIVAPTGQVLAEAPIGAETAITASLDLGAVATWVLDQARDDVVNVTSND